jgi:DNA-binding NtrC family response regulator
LLEEVEKGNFREDLYYRLNVFPIAVPALRERDSDILLLANTFLARHARRHGIEKISFSKNCEKAITAHNWPGNVRELENAVERAVILADAGKKIEADLLGIADVRTQVKTKSKASSDLKEKDEESMEEVERKHIQRVLNSCDGNRTHAAKKLGLNVRTLRNKIKEYDLES